MDGGVEEAFAAALRRLAITRILCDVRDHAGVEYALAIGERIKAPIEGEIGAVQVQPHFFGHLFQRLQALRQQHHIGLIDGCHGDGRYDVAMMVNDGHDLLALLVFVPREAHAIAPFLATVLVPSPWSTRRSSCFSVARCRTLATNACQSDPSSAHLAKTL